MPLDGPYLRVCGLAYVPATNLEDSLGCIVAHFVQGLPFKFVAKRVDYERTRQNLKDLRALHATHSADLEHFYNCSLELSLDLLYNNMCADSPNYNQTTLTL